MLPVMALSTRNGDTEWNVSLQVEIRFIRKKVGKFVAAEDFEIICCPLKGPDFFFPYDICWDSGPTAPPTTEPNKGRQPPALGIPSLGAYLGASRNLYAQDHPRGQ
ncbi:hypothetical protein AVEN_101865-1 [Araneus ventricosus]|uniref:Uncharacterized protein n=1 Tax=Araneus ventricosus TaxID=182803 RepID=A0A4Y2DAT3_ARAVE|nr:hypothetical protein AVEN_101865-1 [Araneus ventricosus]